MKKLILFVEDDYLQILKEFKKKINDEKLEDEKAIILMTLFFMEQFNKG